MQSKSHLDLNPYTNIILCVRIYYMYITCIFISFKFRTMLQIKPGLNFIQPRFFSPGSGGCWPWSATCQIGATSRWHVRSKSHIASISRITTGWAAFFLVAFLVGDVFFGSWGWLRLVFLAIYCIFFVCVSSCSVLRGSEVWWWRCQLLWVWISCWRSVMYQLLPCDDFPTTQCSGALPPMLAVATQLGRDMEAQWKLLWAWLEHQLWQLRGNHPMAIRAWWHLEDCKRSSNENSLIPAAATWLVMWLPFMIGLQGERYCQWMWDLLEKLSHAKGVKSSLWYLL